MTARIESKTLLPKWASRNEWDATLTKESSVPKIGIKEQSSAKKMMSVKRSFIKHFKEITGSTPYRRHVVACVNSLQL